VTFGLMTLGRCTFFTLMHCVVKVSVINLSAIMLGVTVQSVITLSVFMLIAIVLRVVLPGSTFQASTLELLVLSSRVFCRGKIVQLSAQKCVFKN